jgi:hypothetical protein
MNQFLLKELIANVDDISSSQKLPTSQRKTYNKVRFFTSHLTCTSGLLVLCIDICDFHIENKNFENTV